MKPGDLVRVNFGLSGSHTVSAPRYGGPSVIGVFIRYRTYTERAFVFWDGATTSVRVGQLELISEAA